MKNIITIQHTQSMQHTNGMIGSLMNWDLTDLGKIQAKQIGKQLLKEIKNEKYIIYSSDLLRAKRTAEIIAEVLGTELTITDALREFDLGEAIGKTKEWARNNTVCSVWANTIDWGKTIDDKPFIGAESKREVWNRLLKFLNQIIESVEENIIIVSHDGTLSIFFTLFLGLEVEALNRFNLSGKTGGVSFLYEDSDKNRIIKRLNDMSYASLLP